MECRAPFGLVDTHLILQPDLDELVALAGRHVELELLELGLDDAVQGRVAGRQASDSRSVVSRNIPSNSGASIATFASPSAIVHND